MESNPEKRTCQSCKSVFIITPEDFSFYDRVQVPPPTFCPNCRLIRRLIMRNERALYKRKCDLCDEEKILVYPADSSYKVYCRECFIGDEWDPIKYEKDYDFSKSFFEQYIELFKTVPRFGVIKQGFSTNSEYTNRVTDLKNCYLIYASASNENCYYGMSYWDSKDSMDCLNLRKSERCFNCTDCYQCSSLRYSKECNNCVDSWFLTNCRNCQNCFGCTNSRNKNYCIFNEQYSKEEYFNSLSKFNLSDKDNLKEIEDKIKKTSSEHITPCLVEHHSRNVSGNWIENSKNIKTAFGCDNVEDGKYLFIISDAKDVMDYTFWGKSSELIYETSSVGIQCSNVLFSNESWNQLINAEYCHNCLSSSDLFGCVGLIKKQYCILNKQYTKEEYEELVPKIKKHMIDMPFIDKVGRTISYGEFFPCDMTPFAYNETIAQEYFPKTKEQAINEGYRWIDIDKKEYISTLKGEDLPKTISEVEDEILEEVISCAHKGECNQQCTVAFKIIPDELQFYRANNFPLPELCPNCRHYERLNNRNPIRLWKRSCMKEGCDIEFETSYTPERSGIIYCEKCYRQEVV